MVFAAIASDGLKISQALILACVLGSAIAAGSPESDSAALKLSSAQAAIGQRDWPHALTVLRALIDVRSFDRLPPDFQYQVLSTASRVAAYHGSSKLAYRYLRQVTSMPQALFEDWLERFRAADKIDDFDDTIFALTEMARRWPARINELEPDAVVRVVRSARHARKAVELILLQSLFGAHWTLRWGIEPSSIWRDLALLLLKRGKLAEAADASLRVTDAYVLIAMRSDKRFDAVVSSQPEWFAIESAAQRELRQIQAQVETKPESLELQSRLLEALMRVQRYDAALAASDSILMDILSTNYPEKLYQDFSTMQPWFLNMRAAALERVGRWDEAVIQLHAASVAPAKGDQNVSQLIDLGDLYCSLNRPCEALATISSVVVRTSPYGEMQKESVRVDAAYQIEDSKQAGSALAYLRRHRVDAPGAYENALLATNHLDLAASELAKELADADQRQDALLSIQTFSPTPGTARDDELGMRRRAVIAMPIVQTAIRRVGRVESYTIERE